MTDPSKSFAWRTVVVLISLLLAWTLVWGPGKVAEAGSTTLERMEGHDECASVCDTEKHICCDSEETQL